MKNKISLFLFAFIVACSLNASAQEGPTPTDTLANALRILKSNVDLMNRVKFTGYFQPQFQWSDSVGIGSFAGGNFATGVDKRFLVRRGRLKMTYDNGLSQMVLTLDATQNSVAANEVYVKFKEPWLQSFTGQVGIFDRSFGFEVPNSSGSLETPERGRMSQIIMPGEKDLGAQISLQTPKGTLFAPFKIDVGVFNGSNIAADFDYYKDLCSHLTYTHINQSQSFKLNTGVSYYKGGWKSNNDTLYNVGTLNGAEGFVADTIKDFKLERTNRQYYDAELQISFDNPIGITTIRGEYIYGNQPGTSSTSTSPTTAPLNAAGKAAKTYNRQFSGYYVYFLQNVFKTPLQLIAKYDVYDPNTQIEGTELTKAQGFSSADIAYTTLGLGLAWRWDANIRITAYYDMVTNETTGLAGWGRDIPDNVWTFRVQFKF